MKACMLHSARTSAVHWIVLFGVLLLGFAGMGVAQVAGTGSIQGTVADPTGAVIPGATVTITAASTQVKHTAHTDGSGVYVFPNLDIGTYSLTVAAPGFETYTKTGNVLEVGSSIAINVGMTIGRQEQKVEVQAEGLALQTEDASFKQTIDEKTLTEMPLNGRQVTSLITLSGGSVNANENSDLQGSKTFYSSVVVSIAGGQGNTTDYRLDGGDHNDYMTNVNLPFPFPDAVAQFSVETTALTAQSGLHPGGLVNVVTRSGTNTWHGTAFEFLRNNYLDATNFFSTCSVVAPATTCVPPKDTLHQNQYGGTIGGALKKDKLFVFGGYQRLKATQTQANQTAYVPTAANLAGDFSASDPNIQQDQPHILQRDGSRAPEVPSCHERSGRSSDLLYSVPHCGERVHHARRLDDQPEAQPVRALLSGQLPEPGVFLADKHPSDDEPGEHRTGARGDHRRDVCDFAEPGQLSAWHVDEARG
jgi:hypothetical protein